jgi:hypothetical protein
MYIVITVGKLSITYFALEESKKEKNDRQERASQQKQLKL